MSRAARFALPLALALAGCPLAISDDYVVRGDGDGGEGEGGAGGAGASATVSATTSSAPTGGPPKPAVVDPAAACSNGAKDFKETDVDCGGDVCAPCGLGAACRDKEDCTTRKCDKGACVCDDKSRDPACAAVVDDD